MKFKFKRDEQGEYTPTSPIAQENRQPEQEEEAKIRAYFRRIFGEDKNIQEDRLLFIGKWVIFGLLLIVELFVVEISN